MTTLNELYSYQAEALASFYDFTEVTDHAILEIGGCLPHAVPHDLIRNGALSVVTVNYDIRIPSEQVTDKITAIQTNANSLDFPDNTFDSVVSVSTLEHLSTLSDVLSEAYRVLKPNGVMYINGGPLWSSRKGSHYTFTVGDITYHYNKNPIISDWEHLTSSKEEISARLADSYPAEVIEKLLYEVYDRPKLNRLFPSEILQIVSDSQFSIESSTLSIWHNEVMPTDIKEAVILRHPNFVDGYDSLEFCLRKLSD
jgi:SAM-dependent methyltransferase